MKKVSCSFEWHSFLLNQDVIVQVNIYLACEVQFPAVGLCISFLHVYSNTCNIEILFLLIFFEGFCKDEVYCHFFFILEP